MAIQLQNTTGNVLEVDTTFKAARMSLRPSESLAWLSLGAQTGLSNAIAANGPLFSLRNLSANPILIRRFGIGVVTQTAFTAAQLLEYGLYFARAWTISDSGAAPIALTGNNCKHRTSLGTLSSVDCRISTTGGVGAGTRTLDTNPLAVIGGWSGAVGQTIIQAPDNLLQHAAGDYPLVLAQNEGIVLNNLVAQGAAGLVKVYVNLELAEAASY